MQQRLSFITKPIGIPIAITTFGLLAILLLSRSLQNGTIPLWRISDEKLLNFTFTTQLVQLIVALLAMALLYFFRKEGFKTFFTFKINLANEPGKKNNWNFLGPVFAIAFTILTLSYMSTGVKSQNGQINESFYKLIPLVLLFAATNAWSEEILTRFVIVAGLYGKLDPTKICLLSAVLFGLGHIYGTPSGLFGVAASGVLGFVLARSVVETKGMGWAFLIHFLQDVVIFGAGAMVMAGKN